MRSHFSIIILAVIFGGILSGCGSSKIDLQPEFWQQTQRKIGVAVTKYPKGATYRTGSQGLLDMVISNAASGTLDNHLRTIDMSRFGGVADTFVERLRQRGFSVKKLADGIDIDSFPKFTENSSTKFLGHDVRSLAAKEEIDFLLFLSVQQCGTLRPYYGFIALGAPKGLCAGRGVMVNLATNKVEWLTKFEGDDATVEVAGEWDQPPDFKNLTAAIDTAIEKAQKMLETRFFEPDVKK